MGGTKPHTTPNLYWQGFPSSCLRGLILVEVLRAIFLLWNKNWIGEGGDIEKLLALSHCLHQDAQSSHCRIGDREKPGPVCQSGEQINKEAKWQWVRDGQYNKRKRNVDAIYVLCNVFFFILFYIIWNMMQQLESEKMYKWSDVLPGILRRFEGMSVKCIDLYNRLKSEKCWCRWRELAW